MTPPAPCPPGQGAGDGALWVFPAKEWVRSLPPPASPPLCSAPPLQGREEGRPSPSTPKGSRVCHHPPVCRWCSINTLNRTRLPAPGSWGGGGGLGGLASSQGCILSPAPGPQAAQLAGDSTQSLQPSLSSDARTRCRRQQRPGPSGQSSCARALRRPLAAWARRCSSRRGRAPPWQGRRPSPVPRPGRRRGQPEQGAVHARRLGDGRGRGGPREARRHAAAGLDPPFGAEDTGIGPQLAAPVGAQLGQQVLVALP